MSVSIAKDGEPLPAYDPATTLPPGQPASELSDEVYAARVDVAIALRGRGLNRAQIAEYFGVKVSTVATWFRRARRDARLSEDINDLLDKDTVFRALDALHEKLEEGDLDATLAVLKGRGHFRNYNNNNAEGNTQVTAIQIVYTTPDGTPPPKLVDVAALPGQIIGTPRSDDMARKP